jgi:RNA polymerase sigma-70 factor (ECF subfamily)
VFIQRYERENLPMLLVYISMLETPDEQSKAEQLYYKYRDNMFKIAFKFLLNESLAEDAVHSAFIRIMKTIKTFGDVSSPQTASLCGIICRGIAIDMIRREHRDKYVDMDSNDFLNEIPNCANVEDDVILKIDTEVVADKILQLPGSYKDTILLYYSDELSLNEIAKVMDTSHETAKKRLQRARQFLKKILEEDGFIP